MVRPYKRTDTTADVGLLASGPSLEGLFSNMAKGLFSLIIPLNYIRNTSSYQIKVDAPSLEELLVAWLNELIFTHEVKNILFRSFDIKLHKKNSLDALCFGEAINPERHTLKMQIKAATYHKLSVWQEANGLWRARVILDV